MPQIILATLNARFIHASLGLRYLYANLGVLQSQAEVREYTIKRPVNEIVEDLLRDRPRIIGLGVYIWNVVESSQVVAMLKAAAPEVTVVLGGPEVSHEWEGQEIVHLADFVITGPGEISFAQLCGSVLRRVPPETKVITGETVPLDSLELPYRYYSDADIAHRFIYVEASRGCPFKCEFCLSALDKTAKPFELERFLGELAMLYQRGARRFKFVDRTFNLNARVGARILEFFLDRLDERLFVHFEIIPDHLPEALKALIARFPAGHLQFEVGVQTFDPTVQALISRQQDNVKTEANLRWLRQQSQAHIHADLIIGLPGEDMAGFSRGFDRLQALQPHEIQVGILKRLRGAPIARHIEAYGLVFNPEPPYDIKATDRIDTDAMSRLARFARYWEVLANSGRFSNSLPVLLQDAPFKEFLALSDWLFGQTGLTGGLDLHRLFPLLDDFMCGVQGQCTDHVRMALAKDFAVTGTLGWPSFLKAYAAGLKGI